MDGAKWVWATQRAYADTAWKAMEVEVAIVTPFRTPDEPREAK